MSLNNPDSRRALRSIIRGVATAVILVLLWKITGLLTHDVPGLRMIARGALMILGLGELLYGAENVTRAVRFRIGPIEGGIGEPDEEK